MAWFNADDKMHSHPKPRRAGLEAMGLWVLCGTYCTDYLTDGLVPAWYVESWPKGKQLAQKLIKSGFWVADDEDYRFLSWEEYQRTKKQVEIDKAKARERKAEWRKNRSGTAEER
ncbi:hypothetical protein [Arthrobacter sp. ok362]|uniref:hypothetical protein n=1 Tax=Arthrobacter sp. ok362 TaxID=1761745 RepID=UPI00088CADD1|nr:hypothetical protein [Arthrobacter sp. ok362]SDK80056.1 hypothetical protein SAMN04487913_103223 [Arthrobacter sp. ok362]